MAQYVRQNQRDPYSFMTAMGSDSRNPASGARNPFIEYDPGNPWAQGVPSVGDGSRDPTGMSYYDKLNLGRQQHLNEASYNAQMDFLNNGPPEWYFIPQQNQPYYLNQAGPIAQANSQRDVGLAGAGATRDVGLASAAAQQALAQAQLDAAVKSAQINTGAAERISSGRNEALLGALGGWTNMLGNTLPGMFGGLGQAIGGFGQAVAGSGNNQQQAGFQDPYKRYKEQLAQQGGSSPNDLLTRLRGSL